MYEHNRNTLTVSIHVATLKHVQIAGIFETLEGFCAISSWVSSLTKYNAGDYVTAVLGRT